MQRPTLLAFLAFTAQTHYFRVTEASPVLQGSSRPLAVTGSPGLAVLLTMIIVLVLLLASKHLYLAQRRNSSRMKSHCISDSCSQSLSSSKVYLPGKGFVKSKSGFYVGLLGSPSWETRCSAIIEKVSGQLALAQEYRTSRRLPSGQHSKSWSTITVEKSLVSTEGNSGLASSMDSSEARAKLHNESSLELLTPPPAILSSKYFRQAGSSTRGVLRSRHSFVPSFSHEDHDAGLQINTFTCKQPNQGPHLSRIPSSDSRGDPGLPSLSLTQCRGLSLSSLTVVKTQTTQAKIENSSADHIPDPQCSPPTMTFASDCPLPCSDNQQHCQPHMSPSAGPVHISKVSSNILRIQQADVSLCPQNGASPSYPSSRVCQIAGTPPQNRFTHEVAIAPSSPLAQNNLAIGIHPPQSPQAFETHANQIIRPRPKMATTTIRSKRSPVIGPSPLRTISFSRDCGLEDSSNLAFQGGTENGSRSLVTPTSGISHGSLAEPSGYLWHSEGGHVDIDGPTTRLKTVGSKKHVKTTIRLDDSDEVLGLIRELARETSAWDASLFVDENFKAMMDESKSFVKPHNLQQIRPKYFQKRWSSFAPLADIPESDISEVSPSNTDWDQCLWDDAELNAYYNYQL
ncbi:hypothetical protein B0H34DRAFT_688716 [Crassisporium funariophilum]|nr:hypothetical protein B0H34DRAFT_688716 [Crassisporium funariophilum]